MTMAMMTTISLVQWPGWPTILCFSVCSSLILLFTSSRRRRRSTFLSPLNSKDVEPNCYPPVEALPDFHWQTQEPVKIRPFKPKYNLTMSTWMIAIKQEHASNFSFYRHSGSKYQRANRDGQELSRAHHTTEEDHGRAYRDRSRCYRWCQGSRR